MNFKSIYLFTKSLFTIVFLFSLIVVSTANVALAMEKISFSDVKNEAWYTETIEWGVSKQIAKGYADGTFKPNKFVTESEFLAMLIRTFEPNLTITIEKHWADAYYYRAKTLNYPVKSYEDIDSRNKPILRKEVAELISATEGVNFSGDDAIHYLLAFGLAEGKTNVISIKSFDGEGKLTRAEALKFVKNLNAYGIGGLLERPQEQNSPNDLPAIK